MKQFGVMSRTADQRVSILKWCFSMCWLSPFKFKIKRYLPLFFFRTNIVEMYSPGECTAGSITPSSSRWLISESIISFSFESNWISGLGRVWCGSLISRWQCCTMSSIFWSVVILDQAGKKCLSLPANFLVVKLTWIGFEFSRSSSSPPASFWSGGGSGSFLAACCCCYEHHHISSYPANRGVVDCFWQGEWNCCLW